jgi:lipopolysaccharide transport system ATP-binding protein
MRNQRTTVNDIAIRVSNLGKEYRIGGRQESYRTLRDTLADALTSPVRRLGRLLRGQSGGAADLDQPFWALDDVSFEVGRGEVVGIIGRNGAGKSTLLKILSRITEPTTGRVQIYGRVGSLLEVGTGFHAELTGRDNIYLNGAILGMRRAEIERKFDAIVDFAEVAQFIDTPVKHYSSGMYLRLAFAVAAHLEPEILIVDEVLAVGDLAFQKKCLGKMGEVAKQGRTVLFVSHDMTAINTLCQRAILLDQGRVAMSGPTRDVVAHYLERSRPAERSATRRAGTGDEIRLLRATTRQNGREVGVVNCREPFDVVLEYEIVKPVRNSRFFILLRNERNEVIFGTSDYDEPAPKALDRQPGVYTSTVTIPGNIFKVGTIAGTVGADIAYVRVIFQDEDAFHVDVIEDGGGVVSGRHGRAGAIAPLLHWEIAPGVGSEGLATAADVVQSGHPDE